MITRRNYLIGVSAALISAPAVARAENLMSIRGVIMPVQRNYYGWICRLRFDWHYRSGKLRGRDLIHAINQGVLPHIPPEQLAYDIARWGTAELSPTARQERAVFFNYVPSTSPEERN